MQKTTMNIETLNAIKDFIRKDEVNLPFGGSLVSVHSQNNYYVSDSKTRILRFSLNPYDHPAIFEFESPKNLSPDQFTVEQISANQNGQHILMSGTTSKNCPLLLLMDTADGRPITSKKIGLGLGFENNGHDDDYKSSVQKFKCAVQEIDAGVIKGMVDLSVVQISWHPHSIQHFAVLTSDNDFRVYNVQNLHRVEQSITLKFGIKRQLGIFSDNKSNEVVRFEFSKGDGYVWSLFTVYFLRADGGIFAMCPIAPFGMTVQKPVADTLLNSTEENSGAREWVKQTLLPTNVFEFEHENSQIQEISVLARPFLNHVPTLQGPLNNVRSLQQEFLTSRENSQKVFPQLIENTFQTEKGYASCMGVVGSNGKVGFLWQSEEVMPVWTRGEPMVLKNQAGRVIQIQWVSQATVSGDESMHLLDIVDPKFVPTKHEAEIIEDFPTYSPVRLLSTKVFSENLYACISKDGAMIIKLPWLKQLAEMSETGGDLNQSDLMQINIQRINLQGQVLNEKESVGTKQTRDFLVGFAVSNLNIYQFELVSLLSDGKLRVTVPDSDDLGYKVNEATLNENQININSAPHPTPQVDRPPTGANCSVKVPQNADMPIIVDQMGQGIKNLRETYLKFLHKSHYNMKQRMKELREVPDLSPQVSQMEEMYKQVLKKNEDIEERIVRAKKIRKNLQERFELMKEVTMLNMSLSQEMSEEEIKFKHELAEMQREHRVLAEKSDQLRKQFTDCWNRDVDGGRGMHKMQQMQPENVSSAHLGKLKEMLEMQNKVIADIKNQVRVLERTVDDESAKLN